MRALWLALWLLTRILIEWMWPFLHDLMKFSVWLKRKAEGCSATSVR